VIARHPHDPRAFTQGLEWHAGKLYESTGIRGRSSLRRVAPDSGEVERRIDLPPSLFGEGLARVGQRLIQLTWRSGLALVYSVDDFAAHGAFEYDGEGWGLCFDGERLVMSDGSSQLTFRDPTSFALLGRLEVTRDGRSLTRLNELECVGRFVYANVWQSDEIVQIDSRTGEVLTTLDASGLLTPEQARGADVLNGIAYNPDNGHFYLTGKLWPTVFEVRFELDADGLPDAVAPMRSTPDLVPTPPTPPARATPTAAPATPRVDASEDGAGCCTVLHAGRVPGPLLAPVLLALLGLRRLRSRRATRREG
jgi:glutamine cyclotransferase